MSDVTTSTIRYAGSSIQAIALVVGVVFLLVGIAGFVPGLTTGDLGGAGHGSMAMLLGLFQVSVLHNVVHLLFGVVGLLAARYATGSRSRPLSTRASPNTCTPAPVSRWRSATPGCGASTPRRTAPWWRPAACGGNSRAGGSATSFPGRGGST